MSANLVLILVLFLAVGAIALARHWFSEAAKIRRILDRTRTVTIASVTTGSVVKIAGRVRPVGEPLRAPLSDRRCVAFETTLEENRGGKNSRWVEVVREVDAIDFLVEDGTGRAIVKTDDIKVLFVKDTERRSGLLNDPAPELVAFLARHKERSEGWFFNRNLRYKEGVFEPGETVVVLGTARWEADPDPDRAGLGYRDVPRRLVIEPRPDGPTLATDERAIT